MSDMDRLPGQDDLFLGGALLLLLLRPHGWMHRRVENVSFIDERSLERRVSVDLTLPSEAIYGPVFDRMPILPLAFLDKEVLVGFDVRDEGDSSLPILTKEQNGFVAWSMLIRAAHIQLNQSNAGPVDDRLVKDLHIIANEAASDALAVVDSIEERAERGSSAHRALKESWAFMSIAYDLATRFLLLCPLDGEPGDRRVVKFSYVRPFETPTDFRSRLERAASRMGWIPAEFDFAAPALGEAASYHFEFTAPAELQVSGSQAFVENVDEAYVMHGLTAGPRAHVYLSEEDPEAEGFVSVWLRTPRTGLTRASLVLTAATFLLMLFFQWDDRITSIKPSEPVAILLSIPALVSTFIVRPGEHGLATQLLVGIRAVVGMAGLAAFLGAVLLVGRVSESTLLCWWKWLLIVAGACFISSLLAFVGLPAPGRIEEMSIPIAEMEDNEDDGQES